MDRDAWRDRAGGSGIAATDSGRRQPVPPSGSHRIFDVLSHPCNAGGARSDAAFSDSGLRRGGIPGPKCEEQEARRLVLEAARARLEEIRQSDPSGFAEVYDDLEQHYIHRLAGIGGLTRDPQAEHYFRFLDLSRALVGVERATALRLRDQGRITDEILRELEYELDLNESRLAAATTAH